MTHPPAERLSEYLDRELPPSEREPLDRHLADCPACADLLGELRRVVARAQALDDRPPSRDLWPDIAALIGVGSPRRRRRRFVFSPPELVAAGLAVMVFSAGAALWLARDHTAALPAPAVVAAPQVFASDAPSPRGYAPAVRNLEQALAAGRGRLDPRTERIVDEKLLLIDRAIGEAERALAADPKSPYLTSHLAQTRRRKLDLLRRAVTLTAAQS